MQSRTSPKPRRFLHPTSLATFGLLTVLVYLQWPMFLESIYVMLGTPIPEPSVQWRADYREAKLEAAQSHSPMLLVFGGEYCPPCRIMKRTVWNKKEVGELANTHFVPYYADVASDSALCREFDIGKIPVVLIVSSEGKEIVRRGSMTVGQTVECLNSVPSIAKR